jgi:hypothetical protein
MENVKFLKNFFVRGNRYTIAFNGSEVVSAWDGDDGYQIHSPSHLHNIQKAFDLYNA